MTVAIPPTDAIWHVTDTYGYAADTPVKENNHLVAVKQLSALVADRNKWERVATQQHGVIQNASVALFRAAEILREDTKAMVDDCNDALVAFDLAIQEGK